jgi:hypothetical protein
VSDDSRDGEIHRVSDIAIEAADDDELVRRRRRRRCPGTLDHKARESLEQHRRTNRHDHPTDDL